jgi:hypothetical protein
MSTQPPGTAAFREQSVVRRGEAMSRGLLNKIGRSRVVVAMSISAGLILAGCASTVPASIPRATSHAIPPVKAFVQGPSSRSTNVASGQLSSSQATLQQLWATLDSGLRTDEPWPERPAGQLPQTFEDFASAIIQRCEPGLSPAQVQHLEQLHQAVVTQAAQAGVDLYSTEKSYFTAATRSCM